MHLCVCLCVWGGGCRDHCGNIQRANLPDYGNLGRRESGDHQAATACQQQDRHREHAHFTRRYGLNPNPQITPLPPPHVPLPRLLRMYLLFLFSVSYPLEAQQTVGVSPRHKTKCCCNASVSQKRGTKVPQCCLLAPWCFLPPFFLPPSSLLCCLVCKRPVLMSTDHGSPLISFWTPKKLLTFSTCSAPGKIFLLKLFIKSN